KGHIDALSYPFHFGTGNLLLDAFGLSVHTISNVTTGSTAHHGTNDGAKGRISFSYIVPDDSTDNGAATCSDCGSFLGVVCVFHGITAQNKAQGHKCRYTF